MLQPVGPLPPEVYRRRRVAAVAGVVVVLVLLFWVGSAIAGGSPSPSGSAAAPTTTTATAPPSSAATSTPPAPATTTGASSTVPTPAAPTSSAPAPAPAASSAPAPAAPGPCPDASIALTAQVAAPQYKVGEEPVFRILVATTGPSPCTRQLDAGLQQVLVYSADGAQRLWSSNDCFPGTGTETKTLNPGEQTSYSVRWSGTTSSPGCATPRTPVAAGSYVVVVGLGGLTSAPVPFTIA